MLGASTDQNHREAHRALAGCLTSSVGRTELYLAGEIGENKSVDQPYIVDFVDAAEIACPSVRKD